MASQLLGIKTRFTDDKGQPLVGGKVYTYAAGTSLSLATYSDTGLRTENTNPVILDDTGSANIFLKGIYRIRITDAAGTLIEEQDNVSNLESTLLSDVLIGIVTANNSEVTQSVATERSRAIAAEDNIATTLETEIARAKKSETAINESLTSSIKKEKEAALSREKVLETATVKLEQQDIILQSQINSIGGGKRAYTTYAAMIADKVNITPNSSIDVTNDADALKNGTYAFDGTTFTKSAYDVQTLVLNRVENPFETYAKMVENVTLQNGAHAFVFDDTDDKNGHYQKRGGVWVEVKYDPVFQSKNYTDSAIIEGLDAASADATTKDNALKSLIFSKVQNVFSYYSQFAGSELPDGSFAAVVNDSAIEKNGNYVKVNGSWVATYSDTKGVFKFYRDRLLTSVITPLTASNINYTTATKTLGFSGTIYYNKFESRGVLTAPNEFVIATDGAYKLELNSVTKKLRLTPITDAIDDSWSVCAYIVKKGNVVTSAQIKEIYIDGIAPNLEKEYRLTNYALALTSEKDINFDFVGNKIEVTDNIWVAYNGTRVRVGAQTVALDPSRNKGFAYVLVVDPVSSKLSVHSQSGYSISKDGLVIGAYNETTNEFWGISGYKVNGKSISQDVETPVFTHSDIGFGFDTSSEVVVNSTASYKSTDTLPFTSITSSIVYGWFDALMAAHPDYITRTLLGNDASGLLPIYQYRFKPKLPTSSAPKVNPKIPKIMLVTAHNERMNFIYIYTLMEAICNKWRTNTGLEALRHGAEFVIVPVGNPWGLDNGSRTNSNGVDVNRNYPVGWVKIGVPFDPAYSGETALSESESRVIWQSMQDEMPDIFYDCHSYGPYKLEGESIWLPLVNDKTLPAATAACTKIYAQYKKKYDWLVDLDALARVSDDRVLGGGIASKSASSLGCVGGTLETAHNLKNDPTGEHQANNTAVNFTADFLGTILLQSIKVVI